MKEVVLQEILEYCIDEVPFYQRLWGKGQRSTTTPAQWLLTAPVMRKHQIRSNFPAHISLCELERVKPRMVRSGGTTGAASVLLCEAGLRQRLQRSFLARILNSGETDESVLNVMWVLDDGTDSSVVEGSLRLNFFFRSCAELSVHCEELATCGINVIAGAPYEVLKILEIVKRVGLKFPLKVLLTYADLKDTVVDKVLREVSGVGVIDMYVGSEVSAQIAWEPANGRGFQVNETDILVEILNARNETCQPGEVGRVVITDLRNHVMPLIRYEIGDLAAASQHVSDNWPFHESFARLEGRAQSTVALSNGKYLTTRQILEALGLRLDQLALEIDGEELLAKYVPAEGDLSSDTPGWLPQLLAMTLGEYRIRWEVVSHIATEENKKYRFVYKRS